MSLETCKKVLKISGIISIVFAVFFIILGFLALLGGGLIGSEITDANVTNESIIAFGAMLIIGLLLLLTGIIGLLEGIFSVRAANDSTKIMPAWIFSLISLVMGVINIITSITQQSSNKSSLVGTIISLLITILIFYAANTIKQSLKSNVE